MPVWMVDANGRWHGQNDTGYPVAPEILQRLDVHKPEGRRLVDVPPLTGDWYWIPPGSDDPVRRPTIPYTLDRDTIVADGLDAATIPDLPKDITVTISGPFNAQWVSDGEPIRFFFVEPGRYEIRFDTFPGVLAPCSITATEVKNG